MNTISRIVTGIIAILLGLFLIIFYLSEDFFVLVYGVPLIIIGIFILLNKKEDHIEEIKSKRGKKLQIWKNIKEL